MENFQMKCFILTNDSVKYVTKEGELVFYREAPEEEKNEAYRVWRKLRVDPAYQAEVMSQCFPGHCSNNPPDRIETDEKGEGTFVK